MKTSVLASLLLALCAARAAAQSPVVPDKVIPLFNGKDLAAFDPWQVDFKHDDPDHVFTVVEQIDGAPALRISGQHWGGLVTKERYANYRLVAEFRWGLLTWGQRKTAARDSGILLHAQGPFGNYAENFNGAWMRSFEFQIIEGGTGDLILVGGFDVPGGPRIQTAITGTLEPKIEGKTPRWKPGAPAVRIPSGRQNWFAHDLEWKDVTGYRGPQDVEHPWGQWNHVEIVCDHDRLVYFLNGTKVNEATNCSVSEGKIIVQSEGAEIYFRKIELHPLSP